MCKMMMLKTVNSAEYLTVDQAAEVLGVRSNTIRNYLYARKFTTFKFKTLTLLRKSEVNEYAKKHRRA
jgi:excisionase family DNA binding protein